MAAFAQQFNSALGQTTVVPQTPFIPPAHSPFAWFNAPSTQTPLDATHLQAAENDLITYIQTSLQSYDRFAQSRFPQVASNGSLVTPSGVPVASSYYGPAGYQTDFSTGAANVSVTTDELGSPDPINAVTQTPTGATTSSIFYNNTAVSPPLAPLPMWLKIASSGPTAFLTGLIPQTTTTHYGRIYIYVPTSGPNASWRFVQWFQGNNSKGRIELKTSRQLMIANPANTTLTFNTALLVNTVYRVEWMVTRESGSGNNDGTITVSVFNGHSTNAIETQTLANSGTATYIDTLKFGSVNNSNLGTGSVLIAAYADACLSPVGPYTGRRHTILAANDDGSAPYAEFTHDGQFTIYSTIQTMGDGGRYKYKAGMPVFRVDRGGNQLWGPSLTANQAPNNIGKGSIVDGGWELATGRLGARSMILCENDDPPDVTFQRAANFDNDQTGSDGVISNAQNGAGTGAGNFFYSPTIVLTTNSTNRKLTVNGAAYYVTQVLNPNNCLLEDVNNVPISVGPVSGATWLTNTNQYGRILGAGGAVGEIRAQPFGRPFSRAGTDGFVTGGFTQTGTTTVGSAIVTGLASTANMTVSMGVSGTGIPANAQILSIDSSSQIHLTLNASANGTPLLTFNATLQSTVAQFTSADIGRYANINYDGARVYKITNASATTFTQTGTTSLSSAIVTGLSSTTSMTVGMGVSGTGIPSGAEILSIDSASQIHLTLNASASGAPLLTFNTTFAVLATSVYLGVADPGGNNLQWAICGADNEDGAIPVNIDSGTLGFWMGIYPACNFDAGGNKNYAPCDWQIKQAMNNVYGGGAEMPMLFCVRAIDGRVEIPNRLTLTDPTKTDQGNAPLDTQIWRSAASHETHNALVDTTTLGIATKVKAGTPVDGDWTATLGTTPPNGTMVINSSGTPALYGRVGGTWTQLGSSSGTVGPNQVAWTARGLITEPWPATSIQAGVALTSGTMQGVLVGLPAGTVVSQIVVILTTAAVGTTPTLLKLGLMDNTGKIVAVTADTSASSQWTGTAQPIGFSLTSPYTASSSAGYYAIILQVGSFGTTNPQVGRCSTTLTAATRALGTNSRVQTQATGQTDLVVNNTVSFADGGGLWIAVA